MEKPYPRTAKAMSDFFAWVRIVRASGLVWPAPEPRLIWWAVGRTSFDFLDYHKRREDTGFPPDTSRIFCVAYSRRAFALSLVAGGMVEDAVERKSKRRVPAGMTSEGP